MTGREQALWRWLRDGTRGVAGVRLYRVENALARSTPDVEGTVGTGGFWVELKRCARPPKREGTPVRFRFQPGQSDWLLDRWDLDRGAWLLCQVDRDRYLMPGRVAPLVESGVTRGALEALSMISPRSSAPAVLGAIAAWLGRPEPAKLRLPSPYRNARTHS